MTKMIMNGQIENDDNVQPKIRKKVRTLWEMQIIKLDNV